MSNQYKITQQNDNSDFLTISSRDDLGILTHAIYVALPLSPKQPDSTSITTAILVSGNSEVSIDRQKIAAEFQKAANKQIQTALLKNSGLTFIRNLTAALNQSGEGEIANIDTEHGHSFEITKKNHHDASVFSRSQYTHPESTTDQDRVKNDFTQINVLLDVGHTSLKIACFLYKTSDFDDARNIITKTLTVCQKEAENDANMILKQLQGKNDDADGGPTAGGPPMK